MGEPAKSQMEIATEDVIGNTEDSFVKDALKTVTDTYTEEVIIALCAPLGTNTKNISNRIEKAIKERYDYETVVIKCSSLINDKTKGGVKFNDVGDRYLKFIEAGNELRKEHGKSVIAELVVNKIGVNRERIKEQHKQEANGGEVGFHSNRTCYIIDSLKRPEEIALLKNIYRDLFYVFGVYAPFNQRCNYLKKKGVAEDKIQTLIQRDRNEQSNEFGQKLSKTFQLSDFYIRIEEDLDSIIDKKISRYFQIIFNSEIITPTKQENAMYLASSAAGNSACMSRQVGACITDQEGKVLSIGWNDVPKFGGGVYYSEFPEESKDHRCFLKSEPKCFNDEEKKKIRTLIIEELVDAKVIDESSREKADIALKKSAIQDLTEYSRAVHAEMLSIINAGRNGSGKIAGGKLYCTTYPCHNCARHIVAAGISIVYYMEPYPKSKALDLHDDAISDSVSETDKVRFLMYDGVAPMRYLDFFKMSPSDKRKNIDGGKIPRHEKEVTPKTQISLEAIHYLEKEIAKILKQKNLVRDVEEESK